MFRETEVFNLTLCDWLIVNADFNSFGHFISVNAPTNVSPGLNLWPPGVWPILTPGAWFWTNLVEDHYMMLQTKFGNPGPYGLGEEDFFFKEIFTMISLCKTCDPRGVANFDPERAWF